MADPREPLGVAPATIEGRALARKVLETEAAAILALVDRLDERFDRAVQLLLECKGRVVLTGMEQRKITAIVVADAGRPGQLAGVVHIHDLWRLEMF